MALKEFLEFLEEHYKFIRQQREVCAGLQILQYPVQEKIKELKQQLGEKSQ